MCIGRQFDLPHLVSLCDHAAGLRALPSYAPGRVQLRRALETSAYHECVAVLHSAFVSFLLTFVLVFVLW